MTLQRSTIACIILVMIIWVATFYILKVKAEQRRIREDAINSDMSYVEAVKNILPKDAVVYFERKAVQ